ncbi:MAG: TfpX/TfpZ family type IV pilin accessory protein [Burkholderiaceae bacterium]
MNTTTSNLLHSGISVSLTQRLKAAGLHFLCSAALVIVVVLFCALVWYPGVLVWAAGLASLMTLVVAVDLVLGPVLTAVVYQPGKKSLKFDLAIIVAIQMSALIYGLHAVYQTRPAFIVFTMDRFEVVAAQDIETDRPEFIKSKHNQVPLTGPKILAAKLPEDRELRSQILMSKVQSGAGLAMMPEHYVPLNQEVVANLDKSVDLAKLKKINGADRVQRVLSNHLPEAERITYFPLVARDVDMTVVVDKATGSVLDIVDLRPWS